jgi:hypothetical protein
MIESASKIGPSDSFVSVLLGLAQDHQGKWLKRPHLHRYVWQKQALPAQQTINKSLNLDSVPISGLRASFYDLSRTTHSLGAFIGVHCATCSELSHGIVRSLESGELLVLTSLLRALIERIASANRLVNQLTEAGCPQQVVELGEENPIVLGHLSESIAKALFGMRGELPGLVGGGLRRGRGLKKYENLEKETTLDLSATSVMSDLSGLNVAVPGARKCYEVLCEFAHPNIGNIVASTSSVVREEDAFGTVNFCRTMDLGAKSFTTHKDIEKIWNQCLEISVEAIELSFTNLKVLDRTHKRAVRENRRKMHGMAKRNRDLFPRDALCPCLSGLSVKDCRKR